MQKESRGVKDGSLACSMMSTWKTSESAYKEKQHRRRLTARVVSMTSVTSVMESRAYLHRILAELQHKTTHSLDPWS
jgi:hypothetical protein